MPATKIRSRPAGAADPPPTAWLRAMYAHLADPECQVPDGAPHALALAELRRLTQTSAVGPGTPAVEPGTDAIASDVAAVAAWAAEEAARYRSLLDRPGQDTASRDVMVRRVALACAPLALTSGSWLQWLSSMGEADDPTVLGILARYACDVGVGHPRRSRGHSYLAILQRLGLAEYAVPVARLVLDQRISDASFYLPAVLALLGRQPERFRPEIMGADLCLRAVGLLPPLDLIRAAAPDTGDWRSLDPGAARTDDALVAAGADTADSAAVRAAGHAADSAAGRDGPGRETAACLAVVRALVTHADDAGPRVLIGFRWAWAALRHLTQALYAEVTASLDPAWEMAELMRLRCREGAIYHHDFPLDGRPLASWLARAQTDPGPLLAALARSNLVRPGHPERSPLVNGLVGERGAMFRVFGPADLDVIRRWIRALPVPSAQTRAGTMPTRAETSMPTRAETSMPTRAETSIPALPGAGAPAPRFPFPAVASDGTAPVDLREAYVLLQRRTVSPAVRRYAFEYVHGWLGRARHRMEPDGVPLPDRWPTEGLRPWLAEQHDRHAEEFDRGAQAELPSRERLIESTVQLAPLTMIDGAWLQGFTDYELASSEIGFSLFETYWDELGNGETRLNHPLIYRELVSEMGVDLPPTGSVEFARWPGFRDASFELPVYWLSIGRFPRTFRPEVLGLNLAMELSGVGGSYRRARLGLKKHGFSTRFVDIHNTIDNVATGHSAWAADAIDTFMAGLPATGESAERDAAWVRIRQGYRSLSPPSGFRARLAGNRARRASRRR